MVGAFIKFDLRKEVYEKEYRCFKSNNDRADTA